MGYLNILEPREGRDVPGTVLLDDGVSSQSEITSELKHVEGKNGSIVLVPQPNDDPNNPLNFPQSKKLAMLAITGFGVCIFGATVGPLLNAGLVQIAMEVDTSITKVVQASGYQLLVVASMVFVVNAFARKWGKRPVFLFSSLIGIIGSIVGSTASSYNGLLAARIIQGFSSSAYESLVLAMIGDMFFLHERGLYTAIVSFLLGAVSNFSSVICGPVTADLGWKYLFHLLIVFGGVQFILLFLFVPETQYRNSDKISPSSTSPKSSRLSLEGPKESATKVENIDAAGSNLLPKKTFVQELSVFTGSYSEKNFFFLLFTPLVACLNLAILWVILISGYFLSIFVATAYLLAQIFAAPPYLLKPSGVGYLSLGPFIGGLLASIVCGLASDLIVRRCSHKNKGYYEPEYRLLIGAGGALTIAGFVGFGYAAQTGQSIYLTAFLHGLGLFGDMFVLISTANYALDAFRPMGNEIFLCSMAVKNFIIFGYSYFVNDWAARVGPFKVMWILSSVAAAFLMTYPIFFIFGKKYRSFWSRSKLANMVISWEL